MKKQEEKTKVVYLFGAGATHAEKVLQCSLQNIRLEKVEDVSNQGPEAEPKIGYLTNREISLRVIRKLRKKKPRIIKDYGLDDRRLERPWISKGKKDVDIELLITLLESKKEKKSLEDAKTLRDYYKKDILKQIKVERRKITPRLYSSLLGFHNDFNEERVLGFLTLNYDSLLEKAITGFGKAIDYGITTENYRNPVEKRNELLLKIHGSFDWVYNKKSKKIQISNSATKKNELEWIPPGLVKEYIEYPYNLLLGKTREILSECELLRIIGCSLSSNDFNIISMIFRAQKLISGKSCSIEIINDTTEYARIENRLGFLLDFEEIFYEDGRWKEMESELGISSTKNPFLDWLFFISHEIDNDELKENPYLKDLESWIRNDKG